MTENPYAPPAADVRDVAPALPVPAVHPYVRYACLLMWLSLGLGFLGSAIQLFQFRDAAAVTGGIIGLIIGAAIGGAITLWVTLKLSAGRNWMRWLVNIVTLGSYALILVFWNSFFEAAFEATPWRPVDLLITAGQSIVSLAPVVLINLPAARDWFAAMTASSEKAAG